MDHKDQIMSILTEMFGGEIPEDAAMNMEASFQTTEMLKEIEHLLTTETRRQILELVRRIQIAVYIDREPETAQIFMTELRQATFKLWRRRNEVKPGQALQFLVMDHIKAKYAKK